MLFSLQSLAPLAVFILAVLTLFLGMAMEWLLSHQLMPWYLAVILICQVVQMVFPVFLRLVCISFVLKLINFYNETSSRDKSTSNFLYIFLVHKF